MNNHQKTAEDRITELEMALAHQQRYVEVLNEVIVDQSRQIESVDRKLRTLHEQMDTMRSLVKSGEKTPVEDENPPHY